MKMVKCIADDDFEEARKIGENFSVREEDIRLIVEEGARRLLAEKSLRNFRKIVERFEIPMSKIHEMVKEEIEKECASGRIEAALSIVKLLGLSEEDIMNTPEVRDAIRRGTPERF